MPTLEPTNQTGANFADTLPEDIAERLLLYKRELGISDGRLLPLLGLTPADVTVLPGGGVDWPATVAAHEDEGWWAEWMLCETLASFRFDVGRMRAEIGQASRRAFPIPRPGGGSIPATDLPPAERDRTLLTLLALTGGMGREALLAYLAQPGEPAASPS
jgi:hypothetical protein